MEKFGVNDLRGLTKDQLEIVISHYEEDLQWIPNVRQWVTIYDKSGAEYPGAIELPNLGREAGTYLSHIVDRYDSLADRTIFFQGDPFKHEMRPLLSDYVKPELPFVTQYNDPRKMDDAYLFLDCDGKEHGFLVPDKYAWFKLIGRVPSWKHDHNWGAQFSVTRDKIREISLDEWKTLLHISQQEHLVLATGKRYDNYEIAVMFEYTWPTIFMGERIYETQGT